MKRKIEEYIGPNKRSALNNLGYDADDESGEDSDVEENQGNNNQNIVNENTSEASVVNALPMVAGGFWIRYLSSDEELSDLEDVDSVNNEYLTDRESRSSSSNYSSGSSSSGSLSNVTTEYYGSAGSNGSLTDSDGGFHYVGHSANIHSW